jgi:hypothetical protein
MNSKKQKEKNAKRKIHKEKKREKKQRLSITPQNKSRFQNFKMRILAVVSVLAHCQPKT